MYKAIFEVPAIVSVEVVIEDALDQTDALARAYDKVATAALTGASVVSINAAGAVNVVLERVSARASAPEPVKHQPPEIPTAESVLASRQDGYVVHLYPGRMPELGTPGTVQLEGLDFASCKQQLVDKVQLDPQGFGSGRVVNKLTGSVMLTASNARGDWEVRGEDGRGVAKHTETWLDWKTALSTAKSLAARPDIAVVVVTDYTDRNRGPQTFRRIE